MSYQEEDDMALDPELVELAAGNKKKGEEIEVKATEEEVKPAPKQEPKVACFISKKELPISETVELPYKDKKVHVAKSFVHFPLA